MGVPAFYKWLVRKYPNIVVAAIEEKGEILDTSSPNPNGEFDNLYLDMNGIIHPCFHPDDHFSPPTSFEDVFKSIFEYIDRLFGLVRPRKLLFLAIDGVAPRAKMNQQRSRRFRTAKDNETAEAEESRLRREFEMEGKRVLPKSESEVSDSNIITPGTKFMYELSNALQSYIREKLTSDVGWKDIKVILSDANVPGEGEHKIMSFIRLQRTLADYNSNTHHCLYGLDADLIMLALATHEVHFSILREDVLKVEQHLSCESGLQTSLIKEESTLGKSRGWFKQIPEASQNVSLIRMPYQFLKIGILREYLELDMKISELPENMKMIDFERILDDFIFLCFFTGNDFLPHMPTLEIHEGAIDLLMHVYKANFKKLGGYLVDMQRIEDKKAGYVKLKRIENFILLIGAYEDKIFKKRLELRNLKLRRALRESLNADDEPETSNSNCALLSRNAPSSKGLYITPLKMCQSSSGTKSFAADNDQVLENTRALKEKLKDCIRKKCDLFQNGGLGNDKMKLGTDGSKNKYYDLKFAADSREKIETTRKTIVQKYTEGLCWVLLYYFSDVPSWTWFYPFHYGTFASDLKGLAQVKVQFQKGSPFKPFDQLMAVLPPRSAHALPKAYQSLMIDENSNIVDFYPSDFEVDTDGKRFIWQGICKLPFIEEERLLSETKKLEKDLEDIEAVRNAQTSDHLFMRSSNSLGLQILPLLKLPVSQNQNELIKIDASLSNGIGGFMNIHREDFNNVEEDSVLRVFYVLPNAQPHIPRPLEGVEFPEKTITESDIEETQLWHEYQGCKPYPSIRFQPEKSRRANNDWQLKSTPPSCEAIYKDAGTGWGGHGRGRGGTCNVPSPHDARGRVEHCQPIPPIGRGRGRGGEVGGSRAFPSTSYSRGHMEHIGGRRGRGGEVYGSRVFPSTSYSRGHIEHCETIPAQYDGGVALSSREREAASSSWSTVVRGGHYRMPNSANNSNSAFIHRTSAPNVKWQVVGSDGCLSEGVNNLRVSESNQSMMPYGRSQPTSNNSWHRGNVPAYNSNNERHHSMQLFPAASAECHGGSQRSSTGSVAHTQPHNPYFAATPSHQARGRGRYGPNASTSQRSSRDFVPDGTDRHHRRQV